MTATRAVQPRTTLADIINERAESSPDRVFLWVDDEAYTFADLRSRVQLVASGLQSMGFGRGDTIASFAGTSFEVISTFFGAMQIGAVFMAVNTAFKGDFLLHQLRDSGTTGILSDAERLPQLEEIIGELPDVRVVFVRDRQFDRHRLGHTEVVSYGMVAGGDPAASSSGGAFAWNEPACLFYTSGTTGGSKGVVMTQNNLIAMARVFNDTFGLSAQDIQYGAVPLFHVSGLFSSVVTALVGGRTTCLDTSFHVNSCWDRIRLRNATVFFGVGAMVMMLWSLPPDSSDADLPFSKLIAAPIPADMWHAIEKRYGCEILMGYGLSESIMVASQRAGGDNVPGSSGKPIPLLAVRIVDDNDDEVGTGEVGEIAIRPTESHIIFEGYLGRPAETLAQLRNLWFHTGDLGRFDAEGNLYFIDRKKDALRRRGENISSFEVEEAVLKCPGVAECAAFAVPSDLGEDEVMIAVVPGSGRQLQPKAVMDHCVAHIPRFALPRYIEIVGELPRSATGRVQKHVLRSVGVGPATWDRASADCSS